MKLSRKRSHRLGARVALVVYVSVCSAFPGVMFSAEPGADSVRSLSVEQVGVILEAGSGWYLGLDGRFDGEGISYSVPVLNGPGRGLRISPSLPSTGVLEIELVETGEPVRRAVSDRFDLRLGDAEAVVQDLAADREVRVPIVEFFDIRPAQARREFAVLFDEERERFVAVALLHAHEGVQPRAARSILVNVSATSNPLGKWFRANIPVGTGSPHEGWIQQFNVVDNQIVLTVFLEESSEESGNAGVRMWTIERGKEEQGFYAGQGAHVQIFGYLDDGTRASRDLSVGLDSTSVVHRDRRRKP